MERYPEDINITLDDFNSCGWRKAIEEARGEDYSSMCQELSSCAKKVTEEGRLPDGKALWLLADACSMMLKPQSLNEPFAPYMVMDGKRSALPEDFKEEDIVFFTQIIPHIDDPKLSARISEIVWLLLKPRDPQYALIAIDNYRKIAIDTESWIRDGRECWERAIQLCLMLRAGAGERLHNIEKTLTESLQKASEEDGYLVNWLSDLLARHKLGRKEQISISQKLEELAINFEYTGDLHRSRDYFDAASHWYKKTNNSEKSAEMIVRNAECWVKEAVARQSSDVPSHMVAASFYESAIHKYREIPRILRDKYDVANRIAELRVEMNKAGENSLDEMGIITSGPIDISELIENAVKAVQGKPTPEALLQFANVYRGAKVDKIRSFSKEMLRNYPLQSLFSATHMSSDGRVIAKRPGADLDGDNQEATIWPEMVKHYVMNLGLVVQGNIWPALEVIRQEHRLKEADFHSFVSRSPVVPPDRIQLVAKTLYLGYDNDFVGALHLLVPQIENLVRYHLNKNGEKTTNIDINGIENENGLSTLMANSKVEEIFGADLSFELRALFCDPFGPNLRNELAHGLVGYEDSQNIYSIYAWWLMFRLVFNTFWNTNNQQTQAAETENT
jgi:hypothetical protein